MPEVDSSPPLDRELSFEGVSLDQHFDALLEMVRDWDWRTVSLDTGHAPGDPSTPSATSASPARGPNSPVRAPTPAVEPDVCQDTVAPDHGSVPRGTEPRIAVGSMSPRANRDPAPADPPPRSLENTAYPAAPIPPPTPSAEALGAHPPVDSPRGHSKLTVAALYLAGAVAVLLAIGGIRLFA
jgi:hypothetical protein